MITEEDKKLLLKDLCARLPYGVVVQIINKHPIILGDGNESDEFDEPYNVSLTIGDHDSLVDFFNGDWVTDIKPYLRPISSMTEEEQKEFVGFHCVNLCPIIMNEMLTLENETKMFDWLNTHHFDYRGLIPMGLALEASIDMYK